MNKFVEMMKEHEILDALRIKGLSEEDIDAHKAFQLEAIARNVPEMTIGTLTLESSDCLSSTMVNMIISAVTILIKKCLI